MRSSKNKSLVVFLVCVFVFVLYKATYASDDLSILDKLGVSEKEVVERHKEALRQYKSNDEDPEYKRASNARKIIEDTGLIDILDEIPLDYENKTLAWILNDYGYFLSNSYSNEKAIEIYQRVIKLDENRYIAYLNLGDEFKKSLRGASSYSEKEEITKKIKTHYLEYKKRGGRKNKKVDDFLALNIIDNPINNFCEYVSQYANQGRLEEILGIGDKVRMADGVGHMRVHIEYQGTMNMPSVRFFNVKTKEEITNDSIVDDFLSVPGFEQEPWFMGEISVVPYRDGHYLLYHDIGGYIERSEPIGISEKNNVYCSFNINVKKSFVVNNNVELCELVDSKNRPKYMPMERFSMEYDKLKSDGLVETHESMYGKIDFDNDGEVENIVKLGYASGRGRGCSYDFFDVLNKERNDFSQSENRELLHVLLDVRNDKHYVPSCQGNQTGWFIYKGITYFETKYPGKAPKNKFDEYHKVAYIKDGKIHIVCNADFDVKIKPQQ